MGIVNSALIPSSSTGELYTVTEYDDGGFICSCPYGSQKGVIGLGVRPCKHVRTYQSQQAAGIMPEVLPAAFNESELDFDASEVFAYLSSSFAPVGYLCDLTTEILKVDSEARRNMQEIIAQGKAPGNRRKPLSDEARSTLEIFLAKMEYAYTVRDAESWRSKEGTVLAIEYLKLALFERTAGTSNSSIALRIHRELGEQEL